MDNNLYKKNADLKNISDDQKTANLNTLDELGDNLTAENAAKSVWATNTILKDMEHTGADKLSVEKKTRLRELGARASAANLLYVQKGSDSVEMSRIKFYVEGVEQLLATNRDQVITENFLNELDTMMNMAGIACKSYIFNPKKRENARKENVRMVYQSMLMEISRMHVLKQELRDGNLRGKKVSDLYLTIKGEVPRAKYYKKEQPGRTIGNDAKKAVRYFDYSFDPYKMLKPLEGKTSELKKACADLMQIRNTLRSFKKNRAEAAELTLNGKKIILLQKPDNSLFIADNQVEQPLDQSSDVLIDRLEADIIEHSENYGELSFRDIFFDINPYKEDLTLYDIQRIHKLCVSFIRSKTKDEEFDYGNVPTKVLYNWAKRIAYKKITPQQLRAEYTNNYDEEEFLKHVNDTATAEMQEYASAETINQTVEIKKQQEAPAKGDDTKWSGDEMDLLNLIADIYFDADTMSADHLLNVNTDDVESMRKRLGKHGAAFKRVIEDPTALKNLVDRLPLPDIKMSDDKDAMTIKEFMKDSFVEVFSSGKITLIKTLGLTDQLINALEVDDLNTFMGGVPLVINPIKGVLGEITDAMTNMVNLVTGRIQAVASEIAKNTFDNEDDPDPNMQNPDNLDDMLNQLTRGGAAQSRFNKKILDNYFRDASFNDKRSMMASMVRNAKPEKALIPTDAELIDELRQKPENANRFRSNYLSMQDERLLNTYRHDKIQSNICINLLGGMLKGSGPLMQKMVQGLPESILPKELVEAIKDMKSNLNPIPENIVKLKMASIVESSGGSISKIVVDKSLGAASMGQAFLCTVFGKKFPEGKKVVIKLLRSDARNHMLREAKSIKRYATEADASGSIAKSFQGQYKGFLKELNLGQEAKNIKDGEAFNNKLPNVEAMKMSDLVSPGADFIMLEVAEGDTVDRYLKKTDEKIEEALKPFYKVETINRQNHINRNKLERTSKNSVHAEASLNILKEQIKELEKRRDHVLGVCEVTMKEAVIGSGFYHGDLHSGNIMVTDKKATVIDFGNAVHLSKHIRKQITALSVSAMTGDAKLFMESFETILLEENPDLNLTQENREALLAEFRRILNMGSSADMGKRLLVCMLKAQDMGYMIPSVVFNFAQGQMRLMNTVDEMNKKLSDLKQYAEEILKMAIGVYDKEIPGNPNKDYQSVMQKMVTDRDFVVKLAMNVGGSMSKKLMRSLS